MTPILVEISPGELWDKITILRIKAERIADLDKRRNVREELTMLEAAADKAGVKVLEARALVVSLAEVNRRLWDVEDETRSCEREHEFESKFIELARSVYRLNDERGRIKRQINDLFGSAIVEEKEYPDYT